MTLNILIMILYFTFINFLKRNFLIFYLFKVLDQAMHSIWDLSSLIRIKPGWVPYWEHRVLTTGPQGRPLILYFSCIRCYH